MSDGNAKNGFTGREDVLGQPYLHRSFPRRVDALDAIFAFVGEFLGAANVDRSAAFDIEFIVEEIFTNMVRHNAAGTADIVVELEKLDEQVRIRLHDAGGEPFDPRQVPEVDTSAPLAERRVGGLGVHLVRKLAASLSYEYRDGTSIVTVVKRLEG